MSLPIGSTGEAGDESDFDAVIEGDTGGTGGLSFTCEADMCEWLLSVGHNREDRRFVLVILVSSCTSLAIAQFLIRATVLWDDLNEDEEDEYLEASVHYYERSSVDI